MTLAKILLKLWKFRIWVGLGVLLAGAAAIASVTLFHSAVYASASTQMLVDSPQSALANADTDLSGYEARAAVYARLMTSVQALQYIGQASRIPGNLIAATGPTEIDGSANATHAPTVAPSSRVGPVAANYKLNFVQNPELPTVDVFAQAPTTRQAIALANGAVSGFSTYITQLETQTGLAQYKRVVIRQLGPATGGMVDPGASKSIALLVFLAVLLLWCMLVLFVDNLRRDLRTVGLGYANGAVDSAGRENYLIDPPGRAIPFPGRSVIREGDALPSYRAVEASSSSSQMDAGSEEDDVRDGVRLGP